jgi:hypothetical protein
VRTEVRESVATLCSKFTPYPSIQAQPMQNPAPQI